MMESSNDGWVLPAAYDDLRRPSGLGLIDSMSMRAPWAEKRYRVPFARTYFLFDLWLPAARTIEAVCPR